MACCLSPSCCPGRRSARRRPASKSVTRSSVDTAVAVCLSSKTPVSPAAAEGSTPRTATLVPANMVDRLRRGLYQCSDGDADESASSLRSPCRCCRRCFGEANRQQATTTDLEPRPPAVSNTEPTPTSTTNVEDSDFMTLFFRNCEQIVLDNAATINDMLESSSEHCAAADNIDDEQAPTTDVWTSEPSPSTSLAERHRHLSGSISANNRRYDVLSTAAGSGVCIPTNNTDDTSPRTDGQHIEALVAPANSPATSGSLTSSLSGEAPPTVTKCVGSPPSMKTRRLSADDRLPVVRRRPSVGGQSPAAPVSATSWTVDRHCGGRRRRPHRPDSTYTSTDDDDDDVHFELVANRKSAAGTNRPTLVPGGLGSRPPCLGQECSPIRSTPCGAAPETNSSAATAGTTSHGGGLTLRVIPPGRTAAHPTVSTTTVLRRRRRRRSAPYCPHPPHLRGGEVLDAPSPAAVQQSCHKVDTWLRRHNVGHDDVTPTSGRTSGSQLKRKSAGGELDNSPKRRVTDTDSCSLPSGTFTSDEDEELRRTGTREASTAANNRPSLGQPQIIPPSLCSPRPSPGYTPSRQTLPHRRQKHPLVNVCGSARSRPSLSDDAEDVSSGALGDQSSTTWSSMAASQCRQSGGDVDGRKNGNAQRQPRRHHVVRRVTRMTRRRHRVAAAEVMSGGGHVETLAVL